ncbi:MAG: hypothetical protein GXY84_04740 [Clostridiales bacterium]|nr:hypothetical protein [Clostridiales bacterium]
MKKKNRKWRSGILVLLAGLLILLGVAVADAETKGMMDVDEMIANDEPRPSDVPSFHATVPFEPIVLSPYELMKQVETCKSSDEIMALSISLGLPLSASDCDYIYQCRNNHALTRYPLPVGQWKFSEAVTLSYTFADEEGSSDHLTFVFTGDGETCSLIDILLFIDRLQVVTDANHETLWLVGEARSGENKSIRWYNLMRREYGLSYLVKGLMANRVDYHIKVQSVSDPIIDGTLPADGMLAVRKQVSLRDLTKAVPTEDPEIPLYAQVDIYMYQPGMDLVLLRSEKYEGMDLQTVSNITYEEMMNKDDQVK